MSLQTLSELEQELTRGRFRPAYVLTGSEEYLIGQAVALLKSAAVAPDALAFNYTEFSAADASINQILEAANTFPMLSARRFVLVTEAQELSKDQERLAAYLAAPASKCVLTLVASDLDKRTTYYKLLAQKACLIDFAKLKGPALERWAEDVLRARGYRMSPSAVRKVVELAGSDLQALSNEMEKMLLYAGENKSVPDSAVDDLVHASRQHGIFELTAAIGKRDRRAALRLLGNLLESGEPALVVVTMMARHFRQVLIAKELLGKGRNVRDVAGAAQIPSFVMDEFIRQVRGTDAAVAQQMYLRLSEIDLRLKSTGVNERLLLESLVCSL